MTAGPSDPAGIPPEDVYELPLLIALPDEYAWTLRIVRIVFDNNGALDASYQLPCAEAVCCRFIVPVSGYSDLAGCDEALYSGKGPTHPTHELIPTITS